jgi:L-ascorbate metabolism protein UlaG (beta-lactamase superfamily)
MPFKTILRKKTTITWLGHATWSIVTPEGANVLIDAWVDSNPACPAAARAEAKSNISAVLLTHGHFDHITDIGSILGANPGAKVACQFDIAPYLQSKGVAGDAIIGFNCGGTVRVAGMDVTMTAAMHSSSFNQDGQIIPLGESVGFVLRMSNGFTIYHTGDSSVTSDMGIIGKLYRPDLAILPIGDWFTMGPKQAAYALKLIGAKYALGSHWGSFPILTGTPDKLKAECKKLGVTTRVIALAPGESVA